MPPAPTLADAITAERRRLLDGERPAYHVTWAIAAIGAIDVRIVELPIIHLYVPDSASVIDGARTLIAVTLETDPGCFDVLLALTASVPVATVHPRT